MTRRTRLAALFGPKIGPRRRSGALLLLSGGHRTAPMAAAQPPGGVYEVPILTAAVDGVGSAARALGVGPSRNRALVGPLPFRSTFLGAENSNRPRRCS